MKKFLWIIPVVVILIILALVFGRNILARAIVVKGIKQACGLNIDIAKVDISLPRVAVYGLKIYNPPGFNDKVLAEIPEIALDLDLPGFFENKVHIRMLKLDVQALHVVLNEQGKLNLNALAVLIPKEGGGKPPEVKIDELVVKISSVSYKGYLPVAGVKEQAFNPNLNETFHDVTDPAKVAKQLMQKIVSRIGIGTFSNFTVEGGVKKAIDDAAETLKGMFKAK